MLQPMAAGNISPDPELSAQEATAILERMDRLGAEPTAQIDALRLTERERTVLRLTIDGLSYTDISRQLFISRHTVKHHADNCVEKARFLDRGWPPDGWPPIPS